jgi:hypothetical protein
LYNTITVSVNGAVFLNGTALISAFTNAFCTNNTGMVYYRNVTNAADLITISSKVVSVYTNYSFNASAAFVVTWLVCLI